MSDPPPGTLAFPVAAGQDTCPCGLYSNTIKVDGLAAARGLGEPMAGGALKIAPKVGDLVTESIYFSPKHIVYFTVADLTQHKTVTLGVSAGSSKYTAAEVACWLPGTVRAPKADVRLWQFTDSRATTYAGVHGTVIGPWTTSKIVDVTHTGRVVMSPSVLWNKGHNFGAWLRATR
jgi:hypothetical protein